MNALLRWWRNLWRRPDEPSTADPGVGRIAAGGAATLDSDAAAPPVPPRRNYTAPPADDDAQREARLGAVLQVLGTGPMSRAELGARVGAQDWGPGRLDAVVVHGVAAGVLVESGGEVRARYAD